jgi:hypothetical protein
MPITVGAATRPIVIEVTANPASIAANTTGTVSLTVPGAVPGMMFLVRAAALESGLVIGNAYCTTAGTVVVVLGNVTVGAIDAVSQTFRVVAL